MISSDCLSGSNTVPLMVKVRLPLSTARFISSPIFFAIFNPSSPTFILLSLVSSVLILSRPTERVEQSKKNDAFDALSPHACDNIYASSKSHLTPKVRLLSKTRLQTLVHGKVSRLACNIMVL